MFRIAVAEDEQAYREQLERYLKRYGEEHHLELETRFFTSGKELVEQYQPVYDILFLDIRMPDLSGMEAAELIRKRDEEVVFVFITSLAQYAINAYEVGALDYILKPVAYETFAMKFARVIRRAEGRSGTTVTLNLPAGMKRFRTRDIYYVEVENHMLHYHTTEGEFTVRGTMQKAEQELGEHQFAKCNHWYLVNLIHVSEVRKSSVIVGGQELEMSRRSRTAFLAAVANCLGGSL
jgi:DNA-binding LytR/AlgR family response regulator